MLNRIGSAAYGVATRRELLDAGVSAKQIEHRLRKGSLIRVYPGISRVGHRARSLEASYLGAMKACGKGALNSGRAAAYLHGLIKGSPPAPEVTAPVTRRLRGVITHRGRLSGTAVRGIPVTTVPRALVDIAGETSEYDLARACHEAGIRHGTTPGHVRAELEQRSNAPGARKLRRITTGETRISLSRLERRFLKLLSDNGLPLPVTNRPAGGRRVDCRWPDLKLTVELDSYTFHRSRYAWEDRRRERQAYARGDQFRRYTWGDVFEAPRLMLRELSELVPCHTSSGAPPASPRARAARVCRL